MRLVGVFTLLLVLPSFDAAGTKKRQFKTRFTDTLSLLSQLNTNPSSQKALLQAGSASSDADTSVVNEVTTVGAGGSDAAADAVSDSIKDLFNLADQVPSATGKQATASAPVATVAAKPTQPKPQAKAASKAMPPKTPAAPAAVKKAPAVVKAKLPKAAPKVEHAKAPAAHKTQPPKPAVVVKPKPAKVAVAPKPVLPKATAAKKIAMVAKKKVAPTPKKPEYAIPPVAKKIQHVLPVPKHVAAAIPKHAMISKKVKTASVPAPKAVSVPQKVPQDPQKVKDLEQEVSALKAKLATTPPPAAPKPSPVVQKPAAAHKLEAAPAVVQAAAPAKQVAPPAPVAVPRPVESAPLAKVAVPDLHSPPEARVAKQAIVAPKEAAPEVMTMTMVPLASAVAEPAAIVAEADSAQRVSFFGSVGHFFHSLFHGADPAPALPTLAPAPDPNAGRPAFSIQSIERTAGSARDDSMADVAIEDEFSRKEEEDVADIDRIKREDRALRLDAQTPKKPAMPAPATFRHDSGSTHISHFWGGLAEEDAEMEEALARNGDDLSEYEHLKALQDAKLGSSLHDIAGPKGQHMAMERRALRKAA